MLKGFFEKEEINRFVVKENNQRITSQNCQKCGLFNGCKHPKMKYTGEGETGALIIGEAPGKDEDTLNVQFVGKVGSDFRNKLSQYGLNLEKHFWKINAVNCFPRDANGYGRTPTSNEIAQCRPYVQNVIEELKPKFIWLVGGCAIEFMYGGLFDSLSVDVWRGLCIPDRKLNAWIIPQFHPSNIFRKEDKKDYNFLSQYDRDLKFAVQCLHKKPVSEMGFIDEKTKIRIITSYLEIVELLESIKSNPPRGIYIDFETTGKRPYRRGNKILTIAISPYDSEYTFTFPYEYRGLFTVDETEKIRSLLVNILENPNIEKSAHNIKFEHEWSCVCLGCNQVNWGFDTIIAAHILDNRRYFTNLNMQAYVNFGIRPYDVDVKQYKHDSGKSKFNRMEEVPLEKLLLYNGLDAHIGRALMYKQIDEFKRKNDNYKRAFNFFMESVRDLAEIQISGIPVDEEYYVEAKKRIGEQIKQHQEKMEQSEGAIKYKQIHYGKKIDWESNKVLSEIFYDILKLPEFRTVKNNRSVDKFAIEELNHPLANELRTYRKLLKIEDYINQFLKATNDGMMHPSFDLNRVVTYRSSASDPSFQNIPVRDEEAMLCCRSGIKAPDGWQILESDFGGIEVCISACYHKDPKMIEYITNPSTDMHRDNAVDIWELPVELVNKWVRFYAKHDFTFPQFYGDFYVSNAKALWGHAQRDRKTDLSNGMTLIEWAEKRGFGTLELFTEHLREVEYNFWNKRFCVYNEWKKEINEKYRRYGYIETFLGFRYQGYMEFKEVTNYPIQGTAFHCLLWTINQVMKHIKKNKMLSRYMGQIHDSGISLTTPDELQELIKIIDYYGTQKIREEFSWIIVPMTIEHEICPVGGNWAQKEKIK